MRMAKQKKPGAFIGDEEMSKPEEFPSGIQRSDTKSSRPEDYPHGIKLVMMLLSIYLSIFLVAFNRPSLQPPFLKSRIIFTALLILVGYV